MSRTAQEYVALLNEDEHNGPLFRGEIDAVKAAGGHARVTADIRKVLVDDGALGPVIDAVLKVRRANGARHTQNGATDNVIPAEKLAAKHKVKTGPAPEPDVEERRRKTGDQETTQSTATVISTYDEPDLTFDDDDIGNMDRFVARFGGKNGPRQLIWTRSQGWLHHDDDQGRWMQGDEYASQAAIRVVRSIKEAAIDPRVPAARQNVLFKWGRTSATGAHVPIMIQRASSDPAFVTNELLLDRDSMLLNCPNGTIDLRTGKLHPHDPANLITKVTAIDFDPDAQSDLWDDVLEQATRGVPDLAEFLQRAAGYTLTGSTKEDAIFILHGAGGTSKSSITQALESAMGMYAKAMSADALTAPGNSGHSESIAVLAGARMAITGEADKTDKMREGLFKRLSGGDTISCGVLLFSRDCSWPIGSGRRPRTGVAEAWKLADSAELSTQRRSGGAGILVDESVKALDANDIADRRAEVWSRRLQLKCPMGPRAVVVVEVLAQDARQVTLTEDNQPIQTLAA
jgi:D5 N terminal like